MQNADALKEQAAIKPKAECGKTKNNPAYLPDRD
jgi:hypothetical protein